MTYKFGSYNHCIQLVSTSVTRFAFRISELGHAVVFTGIAKANSAPAWLTLKRSVLHLKEYPYEQFRPRMSDM